MESLPNKRTQLFNSHVTLGARILEFGGWDMPIQYSGILSETTAVRNHCGIFDVSHMGRVYITGKNASSLLNMLVTSPVLNMQDQQARYGLICNGNGGVIDDTIYYKLSEQEYLIIPNAGNRDAVISWMNATNSNFFDNSVVITDQTLETSMFAIQGPLAESILQQLINLTDSKTLADLKFFRSSPCEIDGTSVFLGRTGYTGEDGFEIIVANFYAEELWNKCLASGIIPCGLGARDVLRLEAALPLYGHELNIDTTPVEAGLARFIKKKASFIGSKIIHSQLTQGTQKTLIGVTIPGKRAPRQGYSILQDSVAIGQITSGSYSPTLDISIALGYVSTVQYIEGKKIELDIRGKTIPASVVTTPFYKRGT